MFYDNGPMLEKKKHGKYSFWDNMLYHLQNLFRWEPGIFWLSILWPIAAFIGNFAGNLLPFVIVEGLTQGWRMETVLLRILLLVLVMMIGNTTSYVAANLVSLGNNTYRTHYARPFAQKKMRVDYDILESEKFQNNANAAYTAIFHGRGLTSLLEILPDVFYCAMPLLFYGVLLARVRWWIPLLALVSSVISMRLLKFARGKHSQSYPVQEAISKRLSYLTEASMEPAGGKDIRMYHMADWLLKKYEDSLNQMNREYAKVHNWYTVTGIGQNLADLVRNGLIYGYLLVIAAAGEISLSEFVLYFGLLNSFSGYFTYGSGQALFLGVCSNVLSSMREFFETKEHRNEGETLPPEEVEEWLKRGLAPEEAEREFDDGQPLEKAEQGLKREPLLWEREGRTGSKLTLEKVEKRTTVGLTLELRNVSFTYPGQEKPVISHINLTIKSGEKLALIGLNGAGKTTLVKLLCGFYQPTEGEILVNGLPLEKIERRQYYSLLSVLFQDYTILPGTVEENIASTYHPDTARMETALSESDFGTVLSKLSQKEKSLLVKEVYDEAVDFSGGEKQRLLLARALYKDAKLLILDEPTAALDPIAENEIYLKYGELGEGKTSVFISHRLSSTRFCDRIILLENGRIAEEGTHESLMEAGGRYAELFEMQSRYYREQAREEERRRMMGDAVFSSGESIEKR
ncbi:MAG: ABC transporter ATP-binding protein/permease [Lachnospiraceae bacterium]|nr:ABC transporter ATP-binding protein/permease [Lachnospiraceae bacterium]